MFYFKKWWIGYFISKPFVFLSKSENLYGIFLFDWKIHFIYMYMIPVSLKNLNYPSSVLKFLFSLYIQVKFPIGWKNSNQSLFFIKLYKMFFHFHYFASIFEKQLTIQGKNFEYQYSFWPGIDHIHFSFLYIKKDLMKKDNSYILQSLRSFKLSETVPYINGATLQKFQYLGIFFLFQILRSMNYILVSVGREMERKQKFSSHI